MRQIKEKKPWYENGFNNWLFAKKKKAANKAPLTDEQQKELVKLNGGWYQDELFIPMMTKRESMMRYASTWKAIWFFCLPTIILTVIQGLYNIVDKSLSLAFVTPHAIRNAQYISYMIFGQGANFDHSILIDTILGYKGNFADASKIGKELFDLSGLSNGQLEEMKTKIQSVIDTLNSKGNIHDVLQTALKGVSDCVHKYQIHINPDKMGQYINVSTQYTVQSYNIVLAFTKLMAIGAGMHYSVEFGRRNKTELKVIAGNGMTYSFIMSILVGVLLFGISFRPWGQVLITSQMGGNRNLIVEQLAWEDVEPLIYGISAVFLAEFTMNMLRSEGKMVHIMIMTISSLGVKFLTSILLMKFTSLEMTGAQLGTIFSYGYQMVYCLIIMYFSKVTYSNFRFKDLWQLKFSNFTYTLKSGFPNFINYFSFVVNGYVSTALVVRLPIPSNMPTVDENGGVSILQELISSITPWNDFILSACVGLNQGVRSIIAYNSGAENNNRILSILKRSSWLMLGWFVFIFALILVAGPSMLELFKFPGLTSNANGLINGIAYGNIFYVYMLLFFMMYPLACFTYISLGLYQGTKRNIAATISTSLRALVLYVPLTFIGYGVTKATGNPIWYFVFIGLTDLVASFILVPMLVAFYKRAKYANAFKDTVDDDITLASYYELLAYLAKQKEDSYKKRIDKINDLIAKADKKAAKKDKKAPDRIRKRLEKIVTKTNKYVAIQTKWQTQYDTKVSTINEEHKLELSK